MKPRRYIPLEVKMAQLGDTNKSLADFLGVDKRTVSRMRTGETTLTVPMIRALHKRYNFTEKEIAEIVLGNDDAQDETNEVA